MSETRRSRRVAAWLRRLSRSGNALPTLTGASFAETLIVPIPIELILVPFMATNRSRIWTTAGVVTLGCLAASVVGYFIGLLFYDSLGRWAIEAMGWAEGMERFRALFAEHGFFAIIAIGIIPIPFQVGILAAGATAYPLPLFILATAIARGSRYFGLALLVWWLGDAAEAFFKRHSRSAAIIVTLLFVALAVWLLS
ncbi:MAG: VTT domain-containing protein [Pseudomonadota bacterium]